MAEKITLRTISSLTNEQSALHALNDNYNDIANKIDTLVSRDGDYPNHMLAALDMNHKDILNVGTIEVDAIVIDGDGLLDSYYTAVETDDLLDTKSNIGHRHDFKVDIDNFPNQISELNFTDFTLEDLDDTDLDTIAPIDADVLTYISSTGMWEPRVAAGAGTGIPEAPAGANYVRTSTLWVEATLDSLSDVDTTTTAPTTDDVLVYDGVNFTPSNNYVKPTSIVDGNQYVLVDDTWTQMSLGSFTVDDIGDVVYDLAPTTGNVLEYQSDGKWKPRTPSGGSDPSDVTVGKVWGRGYTGSAWDWYEAEPRNTAITNHISSTTNPHSTKLSTLTDDSSYGMTTNSNIGIGVTLPVALLDVEADTSAIMGRFTNTTEDSRVYIEAEAVGKNTYLSLKTSGIPFWVVGKADSDDRFVISQSLTLASSDRLTITDSTGYVGLSNSTPTERLDVTGNIKASGTIVGSNIEAGSTSWLTAGLTNCEYRKLSNGVVEMRVSTSGDISGTFPSGYQPSGEVVFALPGTSSNTVYLSIAPGGFAATGLLAGATLQFYADGA